MKWFTHLSISRRTGSPSPCEADHAEPANRETRSAETDPWSRVRYRAPIDRRLTATIEKTSPPTASGVVSGSGGGGPPAESASMSPKAEPPVVLTSIRLLTNPESKGGGGKSGSVPVSVMAESP